jgi:NAD(P)-dependent dehydrogenase (short-subunit alcohol dehydrogenase family)
MKELRGRVAVVTGAASGIGLGIAQAFAARGMKVVLADIESAPLARASDALRADGADVLDVPCDVAQESSVAALARAAIEHYGAVHVLCNNAGVGGQDCFTWELTPEDWTWMLGVNLLGVVHGVRTFMPLLLEQDEGHIVNTASIAGLVEGGGVYGVTKHAVVALSESLHRELALLDSNVRVSVLCPGWVKTRIMESERNRPGWKPRADGPSTQRFAAIRRMMSQLIERTGLEPRDVGESVVKAVLEERFYVLTHPRWKNMIENRMRNLLAEREPKGVMPEE